MCHCTLYDKQNFDGLQRYNVFVHDRYLYAVWKAVTVGMGEVDHVDESWRRGRSRGSVLRTITMYSYQYIVPENVKPQRYHSFCGKTVSENSVKTVAP